MRRNGGARFRRGLSRFALSEKHNLARHPTILADIARVVEKHRASLKIAQSQFDREQ